MPRTPTSAFSPAFAPVRSPWTRVSTDAAFVIPTRIAHTAGLWGTDPRRALAEGGTMITEKWGAMMKSAMELALAPWRPWFGLLALAVAPTGAGMDRAARDSGRRLAAPYAKRVGANRRRPVRNA